LVTHYYISVKFSSKTVKRIISNLILVVNIFVRKILHPQWFRVRLCLAMTQ